VQKWRFPNVGERRRPRGIELATRESKKLLPGVTFMAITARRDAGPTLDDLLARYQVQGPRYTSYPTAPTWTPQFNTDDFRAALSRVGEKPGDRALSLYVHLPFCQSLCWYCGCNVVIAKDRGPVDLYLDALSRELELVCAQLGPRRTLRQVHWGGGTPTFLTEPQLTRLWGELQRRFDVLPEAEVAIEVHPAQSTESQLRLLRSLGFNRVSMGLQDFDPEVQRATHRIQTPEATGALLQCARQLGFMGVNFDLIYGLPYQTEKSWARTLSKVLELRPDRLAVYSFAHIPELLKHQRRMPADAMPKGRAKLDLFLAAYDTLTGAGYGPIGMDHFALPEDELSRAQAERKLGRNFQGYTVNWASDVVAVGASAISSVGGAYAQNVRNLKVYYQRIGRGELATERGFLLSEDDDRRRGVITQLMCNFWVDLGSEAQARFSEELERLQALEEDGLVRRRGNQLEVTPMGRLFVRNVAMVFDAYLARAAPTRFSQTV
jgi:oxygen-independent coproporphyrinogen-3 oxidase